MNNPSYRPPSLPPRTSVAAVISLLAGIAAWTIMPIGGALIAVLCGHMARSAIRHSGGAVEGDALAVAGLVMGWLQLILIGLAIALVFGVLGYGFSGGHFFHWMHPLHQSLPTNGKWV